MALPGVTMAYSDSSEHVLVPSGYQVGCPNVDREAWGLGSEKALPGPLWAALCFSTELTSCRPLPSLNLSRDNEQQVRSETQTTPRNRQENKSHVTVGYDYRTDKRYGFIGLTTKRRWWLPLYWGQRLSSQQWELDVLASFIKQLCEIQISGYKVSKARLSFLPLPSAALAKHDVYAVWSMASY